MQITSVQSYTTKTHNKNHETTNNKAHPNNLVSTTFTGKILTRQKSFLGKIKELVEYPSTVIKKIKATKQAEIDAKLEAEAEEKARKAAIVQKRQQIEEERKLAEEKARIARKQAEALKLEGYRKLTEEQLAIEYEICEKSNNYIWARHIKNILKEKGFVLIDGKARKEFTKESYRPLEVLPYDELSGATFLPNLTLNPPLIKGPHIEEPPGKGNYELKNFSIYNLNYTQRGFGQVKYPETVFSANTGLDIPAKERGWSMGHSYRADLKKLDKTHYCTTLSYNHEKNMHGYAPGFSIHMEGEIPAEDIEKIKDLLIANGHMEKLIKAEGKEEECGKIFKEILNEIITYLNTSRIN